MNRSILSPLITLFVVILAGMLLLFVTKGSADLGFARAEMPNDQKTIDVLAGYMNAMKKEATALADVTEKSDEPMAEPEPVAGDGPKVVLWISISGFRGDYIGDNTETPFFDKMIQEGAVTDKLRPNFPCVEFPAHVSLATGVLVDKHGIPLDRFRTETGEIVDRPLDQSLMRAEPIWTTATRQGIRTLVHDWPMSQKQPAE
ncbi:MAG: alkaline phosphatase family protein, partial [Verrucomicrobiae bacterium]|nr:alkaline phosphatase family protein [Verrucomicrobiae bacterium]